MKIHAIAVLILFGLASTLHGCAGKRIYLIEMRYRGEKVPHRSSLMVGVCPFEDLRKNTQPEEIGLRHRIGKGVDVLKSEAMSVSQSVTRAVKDYFSTRGYEVTDYNAWNKGLKELSGMPKTISLVVGGNIESFLVEARSGIAITETTYRVKIVAFIGQVPQKRVSIITAESEPRTKAMGFDIVKVRDTLNTTLSEVIRKLFKDVY